MGKQNEYTSDAIHCAYLDIAYNQIVCKEAHGNELYPFYYFYYGIKLSS